MGPECVKEDIYQVMTNSRELTNYCQDSIKSLNSNNMSESLNNVLLEIAVNFITKSLTNEDPMFFELNKIDFNITKELVNKPIHDQVINFIDNYFTDFDLENN